jgi:polar amino acid transport system substrate-binding protein
MKTLIWLLAAGVAACAPAAQALTVTACAEPSAGPPWLYPRKGPDGKPTGELAGFTAEIVRKSFAQFNVTVRLRGDLPLIRCMAMVASGEIDFAIGAYYDSERGRKLDYSTPYRVLTPQIFYSARRPIIVRSVADLARYRGCGRHGWSYLHYGLKPGSIDTGTSSYAALVGKLKAGRCDYFPEELEVLGTQILGKNSYLNDPELRHVAVAGATAPGKHLVAAKGGAAAKLLPQFNAALAALIQSGEYDTLWKKEFGDASL